MCRFICCGNKKKITVQIDIYNESESIIDDIKWLNRIFFKNRVDSKLAFQIIIKVAQQIIIETTHLVGKSHNYKKQGLHYIAIYLRIKDKKYLISGIYRKIYEDFS